MVNEFFIDVVDNTWKTTLESYELIFEMLFIKENTGLTARALWDYQAEEDDEISFDPGEIVTFIEMIDEVGIMIFLYYSRSRCL